MNQQYNYEEIPYKTLLGFGLSGRAILSLPKKSLDRFLSGKPSPLMKFSVTDDGRKYTFRSRLLLVTKSDGAVDVMFMPKLRKVLREADFNRAQRMALANGRPFLAELREIHPSAPDGTAMPVKVRCMVQVDRDTDNLLSVPAKVIGRNIKTIMVDYGLNQMQVKKIMAGDIVTIPWNDGDKISIGIDLAASTGFIICHGDEKAFLAEAGRDIEQYTFGDGGCWVNNDGCLEYVEEEDFNDKIKAAQHAAGKPYMPEVRKSEQREDTYAETRDEQQREAETRDEQLTR